MADNFISYNRFTALPPNIAQFGTTVEELQLQAGKPDPNPVASPMPETRVPDAKLALTRLGSDKLRLANPTQPLTNPYEGAKSNLALSRNALRRLQGAVIKDLDELVDSDPAIDPDLRGLMRDSLRRVAGMREYLGQLIQMTEQVYVRSLAASKG